MIDKIALPDGSQAWLVTAHDDVRAALADPRLSLDKRHSRGWSGFRLPPALDANLLNMDPPQHTRIRALVSQAFTPRRVAGLRPSVERLAHELLDAIAAAGQADLIREYAEPLPVTVIGELFGVPDEDRPKLRGWTNTMLAPPSAAEAGAAVSAIAGFLTDLIAVRRKEPGADLLSGMIEARDRDDRLTEDELTSLAFLVLFAGYENSVNLIGNGLLALLTDDAQCDAARQDPTRLPAIVEEVLRTAPPAPVSIRRFAIGDMSLAGANIAAGDVVMLSLARAGRDPDRYDRPDEFLPGRDDAGHLAFGHGIHYCIGAPLARMEGEVAIGAALSRLPDLALAVAPDQLRWRPSFRTHGLTELPVTT